MTVAAQPYCRFHFLFFLPVPGFLLVSGGASTNPSSDDSQSILVVVLAAVCVYVCVCVKSVAAMRDKKKFFRNFSIFFESHHTMKRSPRFTRAGTVNDFIDPFTHTSLSSVFPLKHAPTYRPNQGDPPRTYACNQTPQYGNSLAVSTCEQFHQ
jgi:hypothetical protein